DHVAALQIAVDDMVAVRFGEAGAQLSRDRLSFPAGHRTLLQALVQSGALKKFHGEEIERLLSARRSVDFVNLTDVGVTDFGGEANFRGEIPPMAIARALERNAPAQLLVERLVSHVIVASRDTSHILESIC